MREDLDRLTTGRHISRGILNMFDGNKCICVTELKERNESCNMFWLTITAVLSHESVEVQQSEAKAHTSDDPHLLRDVRDSRNFKKTRIFFSSICPHCPLSCTRIPLKFLIPPAQRVESKSNLMFTCPCQKSLHINGHL